MSEADRIVKRRAAQARSEAAARGRQKQGEVAAAEESVRRHINDLVPRVLAALEANGWPDAEHVKARYRFKRKRSRAAWRIGSREVGIPRDDTGATRQIPLYLLSDGLFNYGGNGNPAETADEVVQVDNTEILAGLQGLLQGLEARSRNSEA